MTMNQLAVARDAALLQTTEVVSSRGWNTWNKATLPMWTTLAGNNEAISTVAGRWKLEVINGSCLAYVNDVNMGVKTTGNHVFNGALRIYQMSGTEHTDAVLTRLY